LSCWRGRSFARTSHISEWKDEYSCEHDGDVRSQSLHLSLSKIDILKTHSATITGRHKSYYLRIYKSGKILNGDISVGHSLLDSGATHPSYISKELVDKHLDIWKDYITWMNGSVMLGDTKTVKPVYSVVSLLVELHYEDQLSISADVNLCIMNMEKNNTVIGLPEVF
jgi:hypothetical protein